MDNKKLMPSYLPSKTRRSLKLLVVGFLVVLFIIPTFLVHELIDERSDRQRDAEHEVQEKWGNRQIIAGPIIAIPLHSYQSNRKTEYAYILPETYDIKTDIDSELRSRGIYKVPLYASDIHITGTFKRPNLDALDLKANHLNWNQAKIVFGISDSKAMAEHATLSWNEKTYNLEPGNHGKILPNSIQATIPLLAYVDGALTGPETFTFSTKLKLHGSRSMSVLPLGRTSQVAIKSDWPSPSFQGGFLPKAHTINEQGFEAKWNTIDLNRSIPQQWLTRDNIQLKQFNETHNRYGRKNESLITVDFYSPVDVYQKTTRAAKYAMAVIALVFVVFLLVELLAKRRIHPVQYILVGVALCIFYTLLLSLAEYLSFSTAYLIASGAIISMITIYARSVTKSTAIGLANGGILILLYGFVYMLLGSQDYTLLIGSIGLFIILAIIMRVSQYIDWYGEKE